jgi:hypothetical protein
VWFNSPGCNGAHMNVRAGLVTRHSPWVCCQEEVAYQSWHRCCSPNVMPPLHRQSLLSPAGRCLYERQRKSPPFAAVAQRLPLRDGCVVGIAWHDL